MKIIETNLPGVLLIEPALYGDARGFFMETWHQKRYAEAGVPASFVQDNLSFSRRGALRGLHFQHPYAQGKLVFVLQGEVFDVAADIREGSPTFGQWVGIALSADNKRQLYIPEGFAHGFCVVSETALFTYKCTDFYNPQTEGGIIWNDPDIGITWPIENPVLSEKDQNYPRMNELPPGRLPQFVAQASSLQQCHTQAGRRSRMTRTLSLRIMLIGNNGQIGWELQRTLAPLGEVVALDWQQIDLADPAQIRAQVQEIKPGLIVNAAAYTAVDQAETEPDLAMAVNGTAPGILAEEAKRIGAAIIHYSTDYVFDGAKTTPYTEEDVPNPLNVYGRTKLAGEQAIQAVGVPHLILRTSWVYGLRGKNFLLTILKLLESDREEIRIVNDQIGSPTWCRMIAEATAQIIAKDSTLFRENGGTYHLSAAGQTSWCGFAGEIMRHALHFIPYTTYLRSIPTSEYPTPARRPAYSVLSNTKLKAAFGVELPDWEQGLKLALKEE